MDLRKILPAVEAAVVSICLLQGIRVLFSSLFGVIYDAVLEGSVSFLWVAVDLLLILLPMLTPLLLKRDGEQGNWRTAAVLVVVAARIPIANQQPTLSAGLASGAGLFVQISFLTLPNAISRWGETSYTWLAPFHARLACLFPLARG